MEAGPTVARQFGKNLHRERKRAGLSQEEVGFRASLHRTEIGLLERGARTPRIDTLVKLAGGARRTDRLRAAGGHHLEHRQHAARRVQSLAASRGAVMSAIQQSHQQPRNETAKSVARSTPTITDPKIQSRASEIERETSLRMPQTNHSPTTRHTTNPQVPCLGRTVWTRKVAKGCSDRFPGRPAADCGTASPCDGRL